MKQDEQKRHLKKIKITLFRKIGILFRNLVFTYRPVFEITLADMYGTARSGAVALPKRFLFL